LKYPDVSAKDLFTDDIQTQQEFMSSLEILSSEYVLFVTEKMHRIKYGSWQKQKSGLAVAVWKIDNDLNTLKYILQGLCSIKLDGSSMLILGNIQQAQNKRSHVERCHINEFPYIYRRDEGHITEAPCEECPN
jgi:hypothetical protein